MAQWFPNPEHQEGSVAEAIEQQTAKLPSDWFLWGAGAAFGGALLLRFLNRRDDAHLVSSVAPILLILGLYNKIVKLHGHD